MGRKELQAVVDSASKKHLAEAQEIEKQTDVAILQARRDSALTRKRERRLISRKINRLKAEEKVTLSN
jgi:hypothetical protein